MTRTEWLNCSDPRDLLTAIPKHASARKLRLFACACCRRIWQHLEDTRSREAVEQTERYADGMIAKAVLSAAQGAADRAAKEFSRSRWGQRPNYVLATAAMAAKYAARPTDIVQKLATTVGFASHYVLLAEHAGPLNMAAQIAQCELLRDIFAYPSRFRPVEVSSVWRSDTALSLARHIYEARDFAQMPILADALQDAGCDNADILNHCHDPHQTHVRGCWVLDLILSKS